MSLRFSAGCWGSEGTHQGQEIGKSLLFLSLGFPRRPSWECQVSSFTSTGWPAAAFLMVGGSQGTYQRLGRGRYTEVVELGEDKGGGGEEGSLWELELPFVFGQKDLCVQCASICVCSVCALLKCIVPVGVSVCTLVCIPVCACMYARVCIGVHTHSCEFGVCTHCMSM